MTVSGLAMPSVYSGKYIKVLHNTTPVRPQRSMPAIMSLPCGLSQSLIFQLMNHEAALVESVIGISICSNKVPATLPLPNTPSTAMMQPVRRSLKSACLM